MSRDLPDSVVLSPEAFFRHRVITAVRVFEGLGSTTSEAVRRVASTPIPTHTGKPRRVSARTIWRWLARSEAGGGELHALEPRPRPSCTTSRTLDTDLVDFLVAEKEGDPEASTPELIERARLAGKIAPNGSVDRVTAWRALKRRGVPTQRSKATGRDTRRFACRYRMQMVLADFKHFRAGLTGCKRLALYFLDDATRYGLEVLVTTKGEAPEDVLTALERLLRRYGRMDVLYVDRGSGFIATVLQQVAANIDPPIAVVYGEAAYPQAHGKIERFNQSAKARALRHLRKTGIDPDPDALTVRLAHDLERYNHTPHESLAQGGTRLTPATRWHRCQRKLTPINDDELRAAFTICLRDERKVSADHVIRVGGGFYEVPRGYAKSWIKVYRRVLERTEEADALYIHHEDRLLRIHPVDVHANARSRRAPRQQQPSHEETMSPATKSAAERAFDQDLAPMTTVDGGYTNPDEE